jgi:hypothetical protein
MAGSGHIPAADQVGQLRRPPNQRGVDLPDCDVVFPQRERRLSGPQPLQVGNQPVRGLVPVVRILGQQLGHDRREHRGQFGPQRPHVRGRRHRVQAHQLADVRGHERQPTGCRTEQHHTEGVQIGTAVHQSLEHPGLLRRHVGDRASHRFLNPPGRPDRQPEVDELGLPVRQDHDVLGLDIPMYQARPMRRRQRAGHLHRDPYHPGLVQRATGQQTGQVLARDQIHDQVRLPVRVTHFVDACQPRMRHAGQQPRLASKGDQRLLVVDDRRFQYFQRIVGASAPSPVDHGPRAAAKFLDNLEPVHQALSGVRKRRRTAEEHAA